MEVRGMDCECHLLGCVRTSYVVSKSSHLFSIVVLLLRGRASASLRGWVFCAGMYYLSITPSCQNTVLMPVLRNEGGFFLTLSFLQCIIYGLTFTVRQPWSSDCRGIHRTVVTKKKVHLTIAVVFLCRHLLSRTSKNPRGRGSPCYICLLFSRTNIKTSVTQRAPFQRHYDTKKKIIRWRCRHSTQRHRQQTEPPFQSVI